MRIVIPDDYQDAVRRLDCFSKLAGHEVAIYNDSVRDIDALEERFRDAEALVLIRERTQITAELIERLPKLRLISQTGRGTAHIDLAACEQRGIAVAIGSGSPVAPAELTWALILAAMRRIPEEVTALRAGRWQTTIGRALHGRTLSIWGLGRIGSLVAKYGRAFSMNVLVWGREGSRTRAAAEGLEFAGSREALFERADVLTLHLKLTDETAGIVGADDLARMNADALFVNTSRAELVQPGVLVDALRAGRPGFAALDVYEDEPIPSHHPLLAFPSVTCTPHLGYVERDSYEMYFGEAFDALETLNGER